MANNQNAIPNPNLLVKARKVRLDSQKRVYMPAIRKMKYHYPLLVSRGSVSCNIVAIRKKNSHPLLVSSSRDRYCMILHLICSILLCSGLATKVSAELGDCDLSGSSDAEGDTAGNDDEPSPLVYRGGEEEDSDDEEDDEEDDDEEDLEEGQRDVPPPPPTDIGRCPTSTEESDTAAPVSEVATVGGNRTNESELTQEEAEHLLFCPKVKQDIEEVLKRFVRERVFPLKKFPIRKEEEEKWCRVAVIDGLVQLPEDVTPVHFGKAFRKVIKSRMNSLRANFQASARTKFESKSG